MRKEGDRINSRGFGWRALGVRICCVTDAVRCDAMAIHVVMLHSMRLIGVSMWYDCRLLAS
jgi:hypothetical protein